MLEKNPESIVLERNPEFIVLEKTPESIVLEKNPEPIVLERTPELKDHGSQWTYGRKNEKTCPLHMKNQWW